MSFNDLLLVEFDAEVKKTRTALERVPMDQPEFAPHTKSMKLKSLAPHVAQLMDFGGTILTTPALDFGATSWTPLPFDTAENLVQAFDKGAARTRTALAAMPEDGWREEWKLAWNGAPIFTGTRFQAYREMFLNHLVHHRAQLGVYLRLNEKPVPATYGPSADDTMGF